VPVARLHGVRISCLSRPVSVERVGETATTLETGAGLVNGHGALSKAESSLMLSVSILDFVSVEADLRAGKILCVEVEVEMEGKERRR
jgi:hypothetical protein